MFDWLPDTRIMPVFFQEDDVTRDATGQRDGLSFPSAKTGRGQIFRSQRAEAWGARLAERIFGDAEKLNELRTVAALKNLSNI